ncbi:MAG: Crp/Fnr family transcriptional regulator [Flavobacteriales bacterium]|nr:Crp/Fnr family transcriptional regulator [Flavobacteriales bacterium]
MLKCSFNDGSGCVNCKFPVSTIFHSLSADSLKELEEIKVDLFVKRKQNIFVQGNVPQYVYIVRRGKIKVFILGENGKEQIVRVAKEGDTIGYRSLLNDEKYFATAVAMEDCELCAVTKSFFFGEIDKNPVLAKDTLTLLSKQLRDSENRMFSLAYKSVKERIAEGVLMLAKAYGFEEDQKTIAVHLYRKDIADFSGVTVETAIRNLNDFRREKLVEIDQKKIKILEEDKLYEIAKIRR